MLSNSLFFFFFGVLKTETNSASLTSPGIEERITLSICVCANFVLLHKLPQMQRLTRRPLAHSSIGQQSSMTQLGPLPESLTQNQNQRDSYSDLLAVGFR